MQVTEIKNFIQNKGSASLAELGREFQMDTNLLRPLLARLVVKKQIGVINTSLQCTTGTCGCTTCVMPEFEIYTRHVDGA